MASATISNVLQAKKPIPESDSRFDGALLRNGGLLTIGAADQLHEPLSQLCLALETALRIPVQADLYASWPGGPKRRFQSSDHETLLFQVAGDNMWTLHHPTSYHPVNGRKAPEPTGEPTWQGGLRPGNLIYIPRGWWYKDLCSDGPSLYVAITFMNPRGIDMIWRLFEMAIEKEVMRVDIPRFKGVAFQSSFLTAVQTELMDLAAQPGFLLGPLRTLQDSLEPRVEFNLPWSATRQPLPPSEDYIVVPLVSLPILEMIALRQKFDTSAALTEDGEKGCLDSGLIRILERVCSGPAASIRALLAEQEGAMERESILGHLSELISQGWISMREPTDGNARAGH